MGEKIVDVKVNQDLGDGVEKIETQSQAGDKFKTTMAEAAETMKDLPGFERYQTTANTSWNAAADRLMNAAKQVDQDPYATKYETGRRQADFKFQQDVLSATYNDLQKTAEAASKLSQAIGKHNGLKDLMTRTFPSMLTMAGNAMKLFDGSHKSLGDPTRMRFNFMRQMEEAAKTNPHGDIAKMAKILGGDQQSAESVWNYLFQVGSPQHKRASFMDKMSKDVSIDGTRYRNFRESLPASFANLPVRRTQTISDQDWAQRRTTDAMAMQGEEIEFLQARIMNNRVLMDAAIRAGIAKKQNGRLLMNQNALQRGQVNMMGSYVMEFMENSLRGMPMYGITDIEDPNVWDKLERKNNKRYNMASEAMEVLDEFAWFNPAHYTKAQARDLLTAKKPSFGPWENAPVIKHSPLYKAFEVPAYKIGDNGNLVEDAHLAIEDSIAMRTIMRHGSGIQPHNALTKDTVYVNIDKRLSNPDLDPYTQNMLLDKYADQVDNGFTPEGAEEKYVFVGVSKDRGIQFVRQSVKEKAEKADPGIFTGGHVVMDAQGNLVPQMEYNSWKAFSTAADTSRKTNTPGEDSRTLYGSSLKGKKIVVFDPSSWQKTDNPEGVLGKIPGLDGASFADSSIIPVSAQGRMEGVKTVLNSVKMKELHNLYAGEGKDARVLMLRAASGVDGADEQVEFTEDTDLLISKNDIKDFDRRFAGKTNAEITEAIRKDLEAGGLSIKTTFSDADKNSRWMSAQLAQTLDMTPDDQRMFNKVFIDELARAGTLGGAVDSVFAGNQSMQDMLRANPQLLDTPFVQSQIREYRQNMIRRKSRGDVLLPSEMKTHRQMFAPWIFDVMNQSLLAANPDFQLPDYLKNLSLKDNQIVALNSWAEKFGISRLPATVGSVQLADNMASAEQEDAEGKLRSFAKFAALVGLDPEGLYLNPNSSILAALQGADFDGDIGEIIEFASNDRNDYNAVVKHILERTIDSHKKKIEAGSLTAEAAAAKQEKLKHTLEANNRKFSLSSGKDIAKLILHSAQNTARIGSASAVNRNAFQMDQSENFVLQAIVDAYEHYDTNTTSVKKGVTMDASAEERRVLGYGAPFAEFFRLVDKKGRDDQGNIDIGKIKELNPNLYGFNLPTKYSSGNVLSALVSRYIAKRQYGDDVVNGDYDWNKLFDELHGEADLTTSIGRMQYGLRQAYLGFLNADYLALSEEDVETLVDLRQKAVDDIVANPDAYAKDLEAFKREGSLNDTKSLAERYVNSLGGKAINNLKQDGLTETVLNGANFGFLMDSVNSFGFGSGASALTGSLMSQFGNSDAIQKEAIEARRKAAQADREKRMRFYNAWGPEKKDEIAGKLDEHSFSYSDLKSFADNPEEWLRHVMLDEPKNYKSTDATVIGQASHKIIQDYFAAREEIIKSHGDVANPFQFSKDEIETLGKHEGQDLDAYFEKLLADGYTAPNGNDKESFGSLGSGVLDKLKNKAGDATLQKQYEGVRDFITNNMHERLMEMFNPEEWEYLPYLSEKWLDFNSAQFGKKMQHPEDSVKMSGRADLVFKKRQQQKDADDEYFIVDMKNFGNGMSEEDTEYMRNQLYLYALADNFRKKTQNGETPEAVASSVTRMGFLLPAQNEFREVDASPEALNTAHAKFSAAIAEIQGFAERGLLDDYIRQIQKNIAGSLFGAGKLLQSGGFTREEIEKAREAYFANERAQYTSNELSGATIGKTLVMHEDYKEYLDNIHAVTKFANKQYEKFGNAEHYDMWKINAKKIEAAKEQARTLELRGMTEESARQSSETSYAETRFKEALKKAAPGDLKQTYDLLRKINNEETPSKGLTEKLDQYQQLKEHVQSAADAFNYLNDQIKEAQKQKKDAGKAVAKALAESRALDAKEEEITKKPGSENAERLKNIAQRRGELQRQYIDNQQKGKTSAAKVKDMTETQKEAAKNKESLNEETKRFEQKFRDDVLKYWEQVGTEFDQTRALTPQSKTASIQDLISEYQHSVINELAAMDDMAKGKQYDWFTEDSDLYKEQRAKLQKHLDPSEVSGYQKNLIGRALTDAEQWNNDHYAVLTGEELDPRIAASMQAKAIAERIAEQKHSFEEQFKGVTLNEGEQNRYNAIKKLLDSFNEEDQAKKLTERAEFDKKEKAARDAYSLQADKQKQEDEIAAWRERIAARQSGKPYSSAAQQEREFQARISAEEEQLRRYEAEAKRNDATASDKANAQARADSTRQYINDMRTLHAEELRVGATADLRDLNTSFEKQISRQGMSSAAISYVEQFDQLAKSIENASLKYDELKKKIEEQKAKGETLDAADLRALADAGTEKTKAETNAKILKENQINQALEDAEQWNNANYATLTGEELDPHMAASMQAKAIAERIATQKRDLEKQFSGLKLNKKQRSRYDAIKKLLDSFNEEDYVDKLTERAEFDKTEKAARDAYSLKADKQKQEDAIAAWRERIAARQSGKAYSPFAQQEREFQARMAAEEEQLRRYEAEAKRKDATKSERANAKARADSTRQYIDDMRALHAEELRVGATADLRDLNASFEKQISRQGLSSSAISYAEQFDQLAKSIENASQKYDELKKKIEEQRTKGETPDAADLQALTDAETEKAKAEANAKILKENQMDQQRASNTARVDAFYNQFSAARTPIDGKAAPKWTEGQANRLKELEDRASWSNFHSIQKKERQDLLSRHQQSLTPEEGSEWSALLRKKNKPLSPNEIKELNAQEQREADYKSVTAEERKFVETGEAQQKQDIRDGKIKEDDGRTSGYFKQEDRDRYNDIKRRLTRGLSPEEADRKAALTKKRDNPFTEQEQAKWDDYERRRQLRLTPKELDRLKELTAAYEANGLTPEEEAELKALQQTQRDIQSASTTAVFGSIPVKNFDTRVSDAAKQADQTRKQLISDLKAEKTETKDAVRQSEIQAQIDGLESVSLEQMEQYYRQQFAEESNRVTENNAYRVRRLETQGRRMDRDKYGMRDRSIFGRASRQRLSMRDQYEDRIDQIQIQKTELQKHQNSSAITPENYSKTAAQIANLDKQLKEAQKGFKTFSSGAATGRIALNELGQSASRVIAQFGRQLFHKALQEAKKFVMEFDSAMTEIQMITLKTDDEIEKLGDQLIKTSMNMKVSVSDVTSAASDLYRQGLSDDEVSVRLEDVVKFAKVAGIKTEEASKIITTALSNGLVDSSEEAMDALVALGDSAATTASEIAKGMQKSAASAKEAGVNYEQLVTMLTIITSKTQLGGSSAGTALSTLFYRLQKVGSSEGFYDENGNLHADTETARALKGIGVDLFNEDGSFRGAYDVLVDIAKNWESASDVQQSMVLNSLGAGRQRSNMATLIQGLSEDDGALADKYLNLAANSEGITDQKYGHYLDTLEASLTNVTNAFDKFVESMNVEGVSTGFLDFISGAISGLASFNEMTGGVSTTILGLTAAVVALTQACKANPIMIGITAGALALTALFAGIGWLNEQSQIDHANMVGDKTLYEYSSDRISNVNRMHDESAAILDETEALLELRKSQALTAEESEKLDKNMKELERRFGVIDEQLNITSGSYEDLIKVTKEYRMENDKIRALEAKEALSKFQHHVGTDTVNDEINDISSILMLRNQDNAQSDLLRWFKEHVQPGATLVANHVQDPLYMQFLWNMITHGPLGKHKISEDYTLKQELGYSDAQTSSDTLGKFLIAHPDHWKMVVDAVVKDMDKRSFEDYVEDQIYDSEMADLSHEGLDNWLNSKLSYIELAMSATPASQEQTSQILETFATNVRSNSDFYTGDPETIASILRKEITALSSLIFPVGGEFDQAGLDTYNKRYSFNGQTNLTAGELAAAKQRYIDEQTKEYFGNHDFTDASTARQFLKINNLYNEDGTIKGEIGDYHGAYFEDNENGSNAIALANAWRKHRNNLVFSTIYDETNNPFDLPETSDYIQPKDPASDSGSDSRVDQLRSLLDQSTGTGEWSKRDTDNMIKTLLENDVKGLDEVYDLFLAGTLNLNGLLNAFPEIASELEKYAIYDAEGVLTGFESGVDAFMYILDMIAGVSDVFSGSSFISMREKAAGARAIFTSFNRKDFDTDGRAKWLQEIVGSELYAKIQTPGAISLEGVDGPTNINDLFGPDLTGSEDAYVKTILSNAVYGIQGLTEQQRFEGARSMFELSKGEGFHNFMKSNASGMTSDYASAIEGGADYFYAAERLSEEGYSSDKLATIKESGTGYEKINEILEGTGYSLDTFLEKQKEIDKELETRTLRLFKAYGDSTENVIANFEQWDGKASDVASAMSEFNSAMSKAQRNAWLREQANGDNWTDEVVEGIAEMTGYSKEYIEEHKEDVKGLLETYKNADLESVREEMSGLDEAFSAGLNDSQWALEVHPDIKAQLASGYNLDFSQVGNQLKGYVSDAFLAEVQNAVNSGVTGYVHVTQDADGKVHAQLVVEGINSSGYTPPPRGGGGGKSAADKLLESHNREQTIRDHIIKMIQYEESMYQNAGQLTNYGIMLQHEIDEEKRQVAAKKEQIAALEKQISKTKKYSDDWYTLRDAIMKAEEEYEELTNTIEENNKKLEENQQAILKLHTELEQTVKQEIETRIQEEREMLDGTVSMQETIVEAIRERYREEWELMQKDIEKKRKALEEEKALIDERLNRRKEAEDEAKKHEELAEYQKQLALISMDPTRTSDVATLREKIQALEEELAWDLAEDEAKMQQDALQDQIDAYDQYEQEYQEWLDKYLEDANNFTDEVNHVMGLGHDELMQWLKDNVTEFGNSLEAAQEQMVQGWDDTFKQMKGIVDTYWDEINKTLSSKENFIAYMQESSSYKNASEDEKKQMLYNWGKAYDDYIAASVVSNEAVNYKHSDDFKGSSSNKSNTKKDKAPAATPESRYELLSLEEEIKQSLAKKTFAPIAKFAEGGLVDYTGPAWVDGTKTKPESFLDAEDTSLLRAMLDGWKHVRNLPFMSNVSGVAERGDGMSIGEVNVTLNEAQFNTDDDYETIAQKVGAAFTKELAKQGFSTARYAF